MLALPDEATEGELATALDDARRKRPDRLFDELRVERFVKGPSAQILHVGPLRRGGSDHRTPCRLERGRWLAGVRSPPRDLPRRPAPVATGATAHDPAPAGRACHGAVGSAAQRRPTAPLAGLVSGGEPLADGTGPGGRRRAAMAEREGPDAEDPRRPPIAARTGPARSQIPPAETRASRRGSAVAMAAMAAAARRTKARWPWGSGYVRASSGREPWDAVSKTAT